jgi:hypothetical protein
MIMAAKSYDVVEVPNGWKVLENNSNGVKFHQRTYHTQAEALARKDNLTELARKASAVANARKRALHHCECLGECGHHVRRCTYRDGMPLVNVAGVVMLSVVALDHDDSHLGLKNLRAYCQICRQYYDADARNTDALFDVG